MQIVIGKIVGGEYKQGKSREGRDYCICNIYVSSAEKSVFESIPTKINIPSDVVDGARAKLLGMRPGDPVMIQCELQPQQTGPDRVVFKDFFTFPGHATAK